MPNTWAEKINQVSIRGTPDILACIRGRFVALELKKDSREALGALQEYKLDEISKADGIAFKVFPENWEMVREWIQLNILDRR